MPEADGRPEAASSGALLAEENGGAPDDQGTAFCSASRYASIRQSLMMESARAKVRFCGQRRTEFDPCVSFQTGIRHHNRVGMLVRSRCGKTKVLRSRDEGATLCYRQKPIGGVINSDFIVVTVGRKSDDAGPLSCGRRAVSFVACLSFGEALITADISLPSPSL